MKREIKFRGILKDAKIWVYGNLVYLKKPNKSYIVNIHNGLKEEVENESIGQFTGIYDKNGVEVYEGDIVNVDLGDEHRLMTVQFRDGYFGFGGEHLGAYYFDPFGSETIEVVDCIYNTNMNKVYEFWYNECTYESAGQCMSLHRTREGAEKAMERHKKETEDEWKRVGLKIPDYMAWGIKERIIEE